MSEEQTPYGRIKGLSQVRRLPRLGKIRLGIKMLSGGGKEYPKEIDWFKFDDSAHEQYPQIREVYGEKPKELDVFFPVEDPLVFFPQAYKLYGRTHGLKCKGNGEHANRMVCEKCQQLDCGCKDAGKVMIETDCPCELLDNNECRGMGSLMVILPRISCGGVWQIDTGSYHSIVDVNSGVDYVLGLCGRIALVPLKLRRVPRVTHGNGKKSTHYTLQVVFDADIEKIAQIQMARKPGEYLIERPHDVGDDLPAIPESTPGEDSKADAITEEQAQSGLTITIDQTERIKNKRKTLGLDAKQWKAILMPHGVQSGKNLTMEQAETVEAELDGLMAKRAEPTMGAIEDVLGSGRISTVQFDDICGQRGIDPKRWNQSDTETLDAILGALRDLLAKKEEDDK